jgi:transposase
MATLQQKTSRGHKYWYIVESRRVNGKPRPVVLAYLGKAADLLKRLNGKYDDIELKSFSHGCAASLLQVAQELDVCNIINKYTASPRKYFAEKPVFNKITAGGTILLAAIGRACSPTSKDAWYDWAKDSSLEYLLRTNLSKLDSQHFWNLMDAVPVENIAKIEEELLQKTLSLYNIGIDNIFYDTTNFYTYIDTTNDRCTIARRGKNKQKRGDLRQVGLAMVVSREDRIPLFHLTYEGNMSDAKVFNQVALQIRDRMNILGISPEKHTIVFDRGNNSKANLKLVSEAGLKYVCALTPYHHKELTLRALEQIQNNNVDHYVETSVIWGEERKVAVHVSDLLKAGQLRGLYESIHKIEQKLGEIQKSLNAEKSKKTTKEQVSRKVEAIIASKQFASTFIDYTIEEKKAKGEGRFTLLYTIDCQKLQKLEENFGIRIVATNRYEWSPEDMIAAYHGQAQVEKSFKSIKNHHHLSLRPQYHWTDQKIKIHFLTCMIGYLLSSLVYKKAKEQVGFKWDLPTFLENLDKIRLAVILENSKTPGKSKAVYKIEKTDSVLDKVMDALQIKPIHLKPIKINGLGVYN